MVATNNFGDNNSQQPLREPPWDHRKSYCNFQRATSMTRFTKTYWNMLKTTTYNKKIYRETSRTTETTKISGGWLETATNPPRTKTEANHQDLPSCVTGQIWISGQSCSFRLDPQHHHNQQQQWRRQRDKKPRTTTTTMTYQQPPTTLQKQLAIGKWL